MVHELRRSQFEPDWRCVSTESEYNAHLGWQPDLILSDYNMPLLDASRALALLRELNLDIPFIVVSGAIGEEVAVAMMRHGATDYLLKDRLARLGPAVRNALSERQLREETRQAEGALRASEVRFYSFMNHNPALAFIKDQDGRMLYMNNTCEQAWNMTLPECEGRLDHELWHPEVAGRLRARDLDVLESGQASRTVEEISLRNGRTRQLLSFRFPFADALGQRLLGGVSVDISEQVRAERALSAALASKELLLKELHHRVKNNLQVISSLLSIQADSLPDTAARLALQETQKRVQSMALVHERLNQEEDLDQLDFQEYAEALSRDLFYCYRADSDLVRLRLDLSPVQLGLGQAIPCGLILNELVTNALKYAFPAGRQGEIRVVLTCGENDVVKLTVADDGVGLPPGFVFANSSSLGLRIVHILSRQLGGTIEHASVSGTTFSLVFQRLTPQPAPRPPRLETSGWNKTLVSSAS